MLILEVPKKVERPVLVTHVESGRCAPFSNLEDAFFFIAVPGSEARFDRLRVFPRSTFPRQGNQEFYIVPLNDGPQLLTPLSSSQCN